MQPATLPFLTDTVAKAKKRREIIRLLVTSYGMCVLVGMVTGGRFLEAVRFGLINGTVFALLIYLVRNIIPRVKFSSVGLAFLFRSFLYFVIFISALVMVALTAQSGGNLANQGPQHGNQWDVIRTYTSFLARHPQPIAIGLAFFYLQVLLVTGIRGVNRKLGPGAFWKWVRGYYYTPKEEERIFMFLDMRRSTELAETLGDLKFSKLVRDFFDDLTGPITETRAEVSHYIGDEAVLTWWPNKGLPEARCVQCFFRMQAVIDKRRAYYVNEYGVVPEFKAGAHVGRVVATEVGSLKSEIVFHGDVLNTTARVQGACSEFGADFLVTEALAKRLPPVSWLELSPIGAVALKGKSEKVSLISATARTK